MSRVDKHLGPDLCGCLESEFLRGSIAEALRYLAKVKPKRTQPLDLDGRQFLELVGATLREAERRTKRAADREAAGK